MTPEQRWAWDVTGFLHLRGALSTDELHLAQGAADSYITEHATSGGLEQTEGGRVWPRGFGVQRTGPDLTVYAHGFAWNPSLEVLTRHPSTWAIIMELTDGRPRFVFGSLMQQTAEHTGLPLHAGSTPGNREDFRRIWVEEDGQQVRCTDFVCFVYLSDVHDGDGGLIVCPGSHHASTPMPAGIDLVEHYGLCRLSPLAGDVIVMPEHLLHGNTPWLPTDRDRRVLALR